jgi:hypothetical protein
VGLLYSIRKDPRKVRLSTGVDGPISNIAVNLHSNLMETWITTQLGHVDDRTSAMYLEWLKDHIGIEHHLEHWWDSLNEPV